MTPYRTKLKDFEELLNGEEINIATLRSLCFNGCPDEGGHRAVCWKLLLNYLPPNRTLWCEVLARKRDLYRQFIDEMIVSPGECGVEGDCTFADHPLNVSPDSQWQTYFKDNEVLLQIDKDVRRLCPDISFFQQATEFPCKAVVNSGGSKRLHRRVEHSVLKSANVERKGLGITRIALSTRKAPEDYAPLDEGAEAHWEVVQRLLFLYAKLNPGQSYVQGMNEIIGPIYYAFACDPRAEWREHAEADTFFVFTNLMAEIRDFFIKSLDEAECGVNHLMNRLCDQLKNNDHKIYTRLQQQELCPQYYSFRYRISDFFIKSLDEAQCGVNHLMNRLCDQLKNNDHKIYTRLQQQELCPQYYSFRYRISDFFIKSLDEAQCGVNHLMNRLCDQLKNNDHKIYTRLQQQELCPQYYSFRYRISDFFIKSLDEAQCGVNHLMNRLCDQLKNNDHKIYTRLQQQELCPQYYSFRYCVSDFFIKSLDEAECGVNHLMNRLCDQLKNNDHKIYTRLQQQELCPQYYSFRYCISDFFIKSLDEAQCGVNHLMNRLCDQLKNNDHKIYTRLQQQELCPQYYSFRYCISDFFIKSLDEAECGVNHLMNRLCDQLKNNDHKIYTRLQQQELCPQYYSFRYRISDFFIKSLDEAECGVNHLMNRLCDQLKNNDHKIYTRLQQQELCPQYYSFRYRISDFFIKSLDEAECGVNHLMNRLCDQLKNNDHKIYTRLQQQELCPQYYSFRYRISDFFIKSLDEAQCGVNHLMNRLCDQLKNNDHKIYTRLQQQELCPQYYSFRYRISDFFIKSLDEAQCGVNHLMNRLCDQLKNNDHKIYTRLQQQELCPQYYSFRYRISDFFIKSLDEAECGVNHLMNRLCDQLKNNDHKIYTRLQQQELCPQYYSFRWLTLLLSQEFPLPDVLRIWDSLFADTHRFSFLIHICCAMIVILRDQLLAGDFPANVKLLQNFPSTDIQIVLSKAAELAGKCSTNNKSWR